jgi:uncharacterized protein involved in exopolysaccharide biosynthesis
MIAPVQQGISQREFLIFFYKYRLRLLMAFLLPFALAVAISFIPVPRYKATSVLIVRLGSEYVYQPETGGAQGGGNSSLPFGNEQIFKSETAILGSQDLHRELIKAIGVDTLFPEIAHPKGFYRFVATAQQLLHDSLKQYGLEHDEQQTEQQAEDRRLADAVERFEKHFDIELQRESAVITVSFEHRDPVLAVNTLDKLLMLYYEKRKQIYTEPRAELAEAQMQSTRERAQAAQGAMENYKLKHQIYSLDDQRRTLLAQRTEAEKQAQTISNPVVDAKIASYTRQLNQIDAEERSYNNLQKEADIANESYSLYSHRLDEAKAYEDLQRERVGSVRVIQPPATPPDPKRLQPIIILAGLFISLISMLLTAAITEFSRRGFLAPEQIERSIGLPVLAVIPFRRQL